MLTQSTSLTALMPRRVLRLGMVTIVAVSALACGSGEQRAHSGSAGASTPATPDPRRYPGPVQERILKECAANGGAEAVCRCTLDRIESRYSLAEFSRLAREISKSGKLNDELLEIAGQCQAR